MSNPAGSSVSGDSNPRNLIAPAMQSMKAYNVSVDGVSIDATDIGVIIAIILYFIAKEPSICMTKLECYLIFLDKEAQDNTGNHLFHWSLTKSCRIKNFTKVIDFMVNKQLIARSYNRRFNLLKTVLSIKDFPVMLVGIHKWLISIVNRYYFKSAGEMLIELKSFCDGSKGKVCRVQPSSNPPKSSRVNIQKAVNDWKAIIKQRTDAFDATFGSVKDGN
mgnify:CR=1 FL=1